MCVVDLFLIPMAEEWALQVHLHSDPDPGKRTLGTTQPAASAQGEQPELFRSKADAEMLPPGTVAQLWAATRTG